MFQQNKHIHLFKSKSREDLLSSFGFLFLPLIAALLCFQSARAQYYYVGVDNSHIKYREIKNDRIHLVYPSFYEAKAQKFASYVDSIYSIIGLSLGAKAPQVPFLFHTNSAYSNATTIWAPKRIELWTSAPVTTYAYPWDRQLAVHELRHAVQINSLKKGFTKYAARIFGEHIYGLVEGIFVPMWFMEGDAVLAESTLCPTGRGKTSEFNMYLKAQMMQKGSYSYDKALLGSMKDYVPNDYIFGYHMVAFGRKKYDRMIYADMMENTAKRSILLQPFGSIHKRKIFLSVKKLYKEMSDSLSYQWKQEDSIYYSQKQSLPTEEVTKTSHQYINYLSPLVLNDSTILCIKTSFSHTPQTVLINTSHPEQEKRLFYTGNIMNNYVSGKDSLILWSEYSSHFRWEDESYAILMEYDMKNDSYRSLSPSMRLYTPSYCPKDNNIIAAIEDDSVSDQHLVLFDKAKKSIIERFPTTEDCAALAYPTWDDNTKDIYLIKTTTQGKQIIAYNTNTKKERLLLSPSFNNISQTKYYNHRIYFIGEKDNAYQVFSISADNPDSVVSTHSQVNYGALAFAIKDSTLFISSYTADGARIIKQNLYNLSSCSLNTINKPFALASLMEAQELQLQTDSAITQLSGKKQDSLYSSHKYNKYLHLFNFHSWAPIFMSIKNEDLGFGASVFSQNLLSSSILEAGHKIIASDKRDETYINYTYQGWYPIINASFKYGSRNILLDHDTSYTDISSWDEYTFSTNITVPYNWTFNNWNKYFSYSFLYSMRSISPGANFQEAITLFSAAGLDIKWSTYQSMAQKDIVPHLGFVVEGKAQRSLTTANAHIISFNGTIYFPSIFINQAFELNLAFQNNSPLVYYFPDEVAFPRGVTNQFPQYYWGAKLNYHHTIAYPDIALGPLLYIKRIFAREFFDAGLFDHKYLSSLGIDIKMDYHIFRITQALQSGLRIGYLPQSKSTFYSFLFALNIK